MLSSHQYADRLWRALDNAQIPARVVHTGSSLFTVEVPVNVGGTSMALELTEDPHGLLWQFRAEAGPLLGAYLDRAAPDQVPEWVRTLLSHLGGRLDEPYFKVGDSVLVGPLDSRLNIRVVQVLEVAGETRLMGDRDARQWPASTAVHAAPLADRLAAH
ncbi:hypothetical protein ACFC26_21975 [Kitasatospora purpeofusca]|uniref:hypothetical protein n=1 Tax=Kitasatospora purpeofusca TaxID=67352 RepID=UPI0035DA9B07